MAQTKSGTPDAEARRLLRDRTNRRRLASRATPGLPVDGDALETRVVSDAVGQVLGRVMADLLVEQNPFFDAVCERWSALFPESPARPGRWQNGKLFLYVASAGQLFALRTKLPAYRRALAALAAAPKRFSVHLEIHAPDGIGGRHGGR